MADVPYQTLYRRYRPQRFAEVLGQDHAVLALRNAVRTDKVGHAYLFSGPRGTGKTSVARILAKALNCANPVDGEPDGTCESCVQIQQGSSLDVHELDAASNNGVEAMRELVSRAALGTPGRRKVYIVDEVHMLSTAASNALLKTLEEPPAHVIFVLATTDPQKVLPTIRSRTQHFEFRLLSPELLGKLVHQINGDANLRVPEEALNLVVRRGKGSARDTLSVLDQVAAAGVVDDEHEVIDEIVESLCERDGGRALVAVAEAMTAGRDAQRLAIDLLEYLRNGFLAVMAKNLVGLPDNSVARVESQARRLGAPALVRAMEVVGEALRDMRDDPDTRVTLEVALIRLTKAELDVSPAALLERIEKLERGGVVRATTTTATATPTNPSAPTPPNPPVSEPSDLDNKAGPGGRPALGGLRRNTPTPLPPSAPTPKAEEPKAASPNGESPSSESPGYGSMPSRDRLVEDWGDALLDKLPQRARSRYRMGRFLEVTESGAVFALPNAIHRDRCEEVRNEVEAVLRSHYGVRVAVELRVDDGEDAEASRLTTAAAGSLADDETIDLRDTTLEEAPQSLTPEQRLINAFPGAEELP